MKKYKIWITSKEFIIVTAKCPSEAIKKSGHTKIWKIEKQQGI